MAKRVKKFGRKGRSAKSKWDEDGLENLGQGRPIAPGLTQIDEVMKIQGPGELHETSALINATTRCRSQFPNIDPSCGQGD